MDDAFVVGNVNRNQPRKRLDLTVRYFAEWVRRHEVKDAYLFLHVAPTGDTGVGLKQLASYYGVLTQLALFEAPPFYGISDEDMRATYASFNVQVSTTQGEGFGLTTFEGMACGIPQVVPRWSALGELVPTAARMVPCTTTAVGPPYVNVIGGVADEAIFIKELDALYRSPELRNEAMLAGLALVADERYRWKTIGERFNAAIDHTLQRVPQAVLA